MTIYAEWRKELERLARKHGLEFLLGDYDATKDYYENEYSPREALSELLSVAAEDSR